MKKIIFLLLLISGTAFSNNGIDEIYFASSITNDIPLASEGGKFDCIGIVYIVFQGPSEQEKFSSQTIKTKWFDPSGKLIVTTDRTFSAIKDNHLYRWAGMRLSKPKGNLLGNMFDYSSGMESFIGQWKVEISIDDKFVEKKKFDIFC